MARTHVALITWFTKRIIVKDILMHLAYILVKQIMGSYWLQKCISGQVYAIQIFYNTFEILSGPYSENII